MTVGFDKRPNPLQALSHIAVKLLGPQPLVGESTQWRSWRDVLSSLINSTASGCHIAQRIVRLILTAILRAVVKHPLHWPLNQEILCMLMFGILQSRQVPAWRSFFSAVGDLQEWVPVVKQQVTTGSCNSWWIKLPPEAAPAEPKATINWVFFHGGAFVAGHALMYLGSYAYWLHKLAQQGISCSILSVEYPLAPEYPFPCAVEAAAEVIEWLVQESGQSVPYLVGGDSAGGNLTLTALALLRDQGKLSQPPVALTLLSPVVDMSDASVFGRRGDTVSSHIDTDPDLAKREAAVAANPTDGVSSSISSDGPVCRSQQPAHKKGQQQQQQQQLLRHRHPDAVAAGFRSPYKLLKGLLSEVHQGLQAHSSKAGAAAAAAQGYFDYIPGSSIADEMHHYLHDPSLLTSPLISPTYLKDFSGLSQQGMLVVAGGVELMRPDIAAFASKVLAAGVPVQYHEEPNEPHSYMVLGLPHLLRKGLVLVNYVAKAATA